jgi:hypothetical protein
MSTAAVTPDNDFGGPITGSPSETGAGAPAAPPSSAASGVATPAPAGAAGAATPAAPPTTPSQTDPAHDNIWASALKGIGKAVHPYDVQITKDPDTGAPVAKRVPSTPGTMARSIIAGALSGMAAGFGAPPGPGVQGRAVAAGFSAGQQGEEKHQRAGVEQAREEYDFQQKALAQKANQVILSQQIASNTWQAARHQVDASWDDMAHSQALRNMVNEGGSGSGSLGKYDSWEDFLKQHQDSDMAKMVARGEVFPVPYTKDGKYAGVEAMRVSPDWKAQKLDQDQTFEKLQPDGTRKTYTVPAGSMTRGDFLTTSLASTNQIVEYDAKQAEQAEKEKKDAAEAQVQKSEVSKNYAEAGKANTEAAATRASLGGPGGDNGPTGEEYLKTLPAGISEQVKAIGEGRMQLPARTTKEGMALRNAVTRAFPDYDQSQYPAYQKAREQFTSGQIGQGINSFNTALNHIGRMETHLPANGQLPAVNSVKNWLLQESGSPALQAYQTDMDAVSNELGKAYKGGAVTDQEYTAFKKLLNSNASPAQMRTNIGELKGLLKGKLDSYDAQWSNSMPKGVRPPIAIVSPEAQRVLSRGAGNPQPTPQTHVFNAQAWAQANPGKDVGQAVAAAKQQGYQVVGAPQ